MEHLIIYNSNNNNYFNNSNSNNSKINWLSLVVTTCTNNWKASNLEQVQVRVIKMETITSNTVRMERLIWFTIHKIRVKLVMGKECNIIQIICRLEPMACNNNNNSNSSQQISIILKIHRSRALRSRINNSWYNNNNSIFFQTKNTFLLLKIPSNSNNVWILLFGNTNQLLNNNNVALLKQIHKRV